VPAWSSVAPDNKVAHVACGVPWTVTAPDWPRAVPGVGPVLRGALARFDAEATPQTNAPCKQHTPRRVVASVPEGGMRAGATGLLIALGTADESLVDFVNESFRLDVGPRSVTITAPTVFGALYGLDTLRQLAAPHRAPPPGHGAAYRQAAVADEPESKYRGMMLSPGQRFIPVPLLETFLLGMAHARLNILHLHLSEFCRFSMQSLAFPNLTQPLAQGINQGFYTVGDVAHVVAQARQYGIRVVPEYDVPGHQGRNLGQQIPALSWCANRPPDQAGYVWELQNTAENREVVGRLLQDIAAVFPDKLMHVGGDEVAGGGLNHTCSLAAIRAFEQSVLGVVTGQLRLNRTAMGWAEIFFVSKLKEARDMVLIAWEEQTQGRRALDVVRHGIRAVDAYGAAYYFGNQFNMSYETVYRDIRANMTRAERGLLLGGECCIWTDDYCFLPQCNSTVGAPPAARHLYPRHADARFARSTLGVSFPYALIAGASWWRFDPDADPSSPAFRSSILTANDRLLAAGVDACPSECALLPPANGGCNETHRCGRPY